MYNNCLIKSVFIRCDANEKSGFGHFSRCINIARGIMSTMQKVSISFIGDYSLNAISLFSRYNINYILFKEHNPRSSNKLIPLIGNCDYFILDSYLISQEYINNLCNHSFKFIIIDDYHKIDLSNTDLVINFCINGISHDYNSKSQALGVNYFPAKTELKNIRKEKIITGKTEVEKILILIGGHDIHQIGIRVINIIDSVTKNKKILFINHSSNVNSLNLKNNDLEIFPFNNNIEQFYHACDLTITGGGLSKYESAYCCIPNGSISQTQDEMSDSFYFESQNLSKVLGLSYDFNESIIANNFISLISSNEKNKIYNSCKNLFNANSLENVVNEILK